MAQDAAPDIDPAHVALGEGVVDEPDIRKAGFS